MPGPTGTDSGASGVARHEAVGRNQHLSLDGASDHPSGSRRGSISSVRSQGSQGSQGHQPSQGGSASGPTARSRASSGAGSPAGSSPSQQPKPLQIPVTTKSSFTNPLGFDPGRDPGRDRPELSPTDIVGKRVDLPADAFTVGKDATPFTARPGNNNSGKAIQIQLNVFPVTGWSDQDIYQYDFDVKPNRKGSRGLVQKCWASRPVQDFISSQGGKWLYDGNKLAWSSKPIERNEARIIVDLDALSGKKRIVGKEGVFNCQLRQTTTIRLMYLKEYLVGRIPWDTHVLECMNFLDHCIRQWPSENLILIRRNFYAREFTNVSLAFYAEAHRGFYSAIRLSEAVRRGASGLAINVDVANTAFWCVTNLAEMALRLMQAHKPEWKGWRMAEMTKALMPESVKDKAGQPRFRQSEAFTLLRRFFALRFQVNHRGKMDHPTLYKVKRILWNENYGKQGASSKIVTFEKKMKSGGTKTTTIWQHYFEDYQIRLQFADLPVLETTRGQFYPLEVCNVADFQRYPFRLDPAQTQAMLKFAVSRPDKRRENIHEGISKFGWKQDPYLNAFGVKISEQMAVTPARVLPNPEITFGNGKINPGVSGRWDLRGRTFLEKNFRPISAWAFVNCGNACQLNDLENFANKFKSTYEGHGGQVKKSAYVFTVPFTTGSFGMICAEAYKKTQEKFGVHPDLMVFVVNSMNQLVYERIKKNMDCRFSCPSQVLQGGHIAKCNAQYMSNVSMKVNAKLGGATCRVAGPNPSASPFFKVPTMIIGLDVSHAAAGSSAPSMAAMTVSMDRHAAKYAASCEVNGWRVEILDAVTTHKVFTPLLLHWLKTNKCFPHHVYFFRDGVSEGQFQHVIDREVKEIRRIFREQNAGQPKFTVTIATKRHHIRFFPKSGDRKSADRNNNALPGTLVEHVATHPHHWDFFLCSHVAIQGTARPVHYQVILDEAKVAPETLQSMIYQQCYQYCRSTTPVSLHPAVYYSHLASQRARSHENIESSAKELPLVKAGFPFRKDDDEVYSGSRPMEPQPLIPMRGPGIPTRNQDFIEMSMWFV
ncbi:eukaryotic translation initiation factor [Biscogniauxia marginata]|nr:eukaryotic translation initiation factor [Biscogniauxia marginata]